jgi:uncharacterized membrane protein
MKKVLLAGETFTLVQSAVAGVTLGHSSRYVNGATYFLAAIEGSGIAAEQLPSERCEIEFPRTLEALQNYSAIIISDVSALTLLLTPEARAGRIGPNRLALLNDYVRQGGSLMMAGGYTSFQGMDGSARYHGTPLEECLPVSCLEHGDGLEAPEGLTPRVVATHPILAQLPKEWPPVLGLNQVRLRADADTQLLADVSYRSRQFPLLAVRTFGQGRTLAFMTDIGPHWMSHQFLESQTYKQLMQAMLRWLCRVGD